MFIESLVALVVLANVTVPVVPDPNYLQQLYPSVTAPNGQQQMFSAPYQQQQPITSNNGATQPTDIAGFISLAVTAGLGYFLQKQKTTTDRRTYMAADTAVKLATNDEASDANQLKLIYAISCMADIMGRYHREDMETYETIDGVSIWTYVENLRLSCNQDFKARYVNSGPVQTTGTQSKDKVVATFNKVQQAVTPTTEVEIPDVAKGPSSTVVIPNRTQTNKLQTSGTAQPSTGVSGEGSGDTDNTTS